jgi:hypothetical protein
MRQEATINCENTVNSRLILPTLYRGVRLSVARRSALGGVFDALAMRHFYEPEGFALPHGFYLPDFWLPDAGAWFEVNKPIDTPKPGMWFEVKGRDPTSIEQALMADLTYATHREGLIAAGPAEKNTELWYWSPEGGYGSLGLGEFSGFVDEKNSKPEAHLVGANIGGFKFIDQPQGMTVQCAFEQAANCRFRH